MRADFEDRARRRSEFSNANYVDPEFDGGREDGPDLDFPTLGDAPRALGRRNQQTNSNRVATRFSAAVKSSAPPPSRATPPPLLQIPSQSSINSQPRSSARISLRPPSLLPTVTTGSQLSALYMTYRASFLELGNMRNRSLQKAAEAWKRGDGAAARAFSREAQDFNRKVAIEGADAARRIVEERARGMKEALLKNENRTGSTDDGPDRKACGKDLAGGVILGVVSASLVQNGSTLDAAHRTEVAIDIHGLHGDEGVAFCATFLQALEREAFRGLAYIVIGEGKHSKTTGKLLESAVSEFLVDAGYPHRLWNGVVCVDALK